VSEDGPLNRVVETRMDGHCQGRPWGRWGEGVDRTAVTAGRLQEKGDVWNDRSLDASQKRMKG
jgi:hypothetical protein